jgi:hypothetical protein
MKAAILKGYPSEMTIVAFYCFFGTIQCAAFSLIAERDPNAWKLSPDIELVSIVYSVSTLYVVIYLREMLRELSLLHSQVLIS